MRNASEMGFIKVAALSPKVTVANPVKNKASALDAIAKAAEAGAQIIVLPELHLSAYTCGDLFHQDRLIRRCEESLEALLKETAQMQAVIVIGLPIRVDDALYNCAAVIQSGRILGVVPKEYLPNYQEFYEKRWFVPGSPAMTEEITLCGQQVPFGELLFRFGELVMGRRSARTSGCRCRPVPIWRWPGQT